MTSEQETLYLRAKESLAAAKLLHQSGYYGFAASRAYYAMFYMAEALLLGKNLAFSKHSAVIAAFGKHFVKKGIVSPEYHRYLISSLELRHAGDYGSNADVSPEESAGQIERAEQFVELAYQLIGNLRDAGNKL